MKVQLMNPTEDFDPDAAEPTFAEDLVQDLELDRLWDAMAGGDAFLREVARAALLQPVTDVDVITYRQQALADCAHNPDALAELYQIALDALNVRRNIFMMPVRSHPQTELSYAVKMLTELTDQLDRVRSWSANAATTLRSPAFRRLSATITHELDEEYLRGLRHILAELSFPKGMLMSARVGRSGQVIAQVLRRGKDSNRHLFDRTPLKRPYLSFTLPERDEAGANALSLLRDRSVNEIANVTAQALDHVLAFFAALRREIAFYLACQNLADVLTQIGAPLCTPNPQSPAPIRTRGIYDPCLALRTRTPPVGNDVDVPTDHPLVITGANRGGKSTLLRALGVAQLMMQAGMPAPADHFSATPIRRLYTHWAREEDTSLTHGKLDEELDRMERIVMEIQPGDLLLSNESFASTNEAEGAQIALEVTSALVHAGVQVRTVTHLYDFAHTAATDDSLAAVCLRAPRTGTDGPSFRLEPGPPLRTSYGLDLYDDLFGTSYADNDS